ncbi:transglycosylase domain-containing protein [Actinomadura hibisca]|uniref:transglycosylase domain-containing protein n=1 Tax=Actinomadura hibisca TaxID=68565 RepID=UPI000AF12597|nr:transglycosylase domain-containing protein [Actinomadura hibisca]
MHALPPARSRLRAVARLARAVARRLRSLRPSRRVVRVVLGASAALVLLVAGTLVVVYQRTPTPTEPQAGVTDEGSTVYYGDGRTPILRLGANRQAVRHGDIPDHVRWAVIAAEDRGFYQGHGVSPVGTVRALWSTASGGGAQGGSTITQQLARNYYKGLSRDRTLDRKAKEIFIALKLDRAKSKDAILDLYLNTIYFGRQTFGVQAAARAYFDKDVQQLTVAEGALLAAMIQLPAYFVTRGDSAPARALRARWRYVIDGMVGMGRLTRADAGRLRFPTTRKEWRGVLLSGQSPLVRQRVLEELRDAGIPEQSVVNGRLKIYTGLDQRWMAYAEQAMRAASEPRWHRDVQAGLVAVDPADGAVRAFYAGDPKRNQIDTVFRPIAQAASTFKPYVLAAALRKGMTVRTRVSGKSPVKFAPNGETTPMTAPGYRVDNDEKIGSLGAVDLVRATALSVNTGFVKLAFEAGVDNVIRAAADLGVPAAALKPFKGQAGVALGVADVSASVQAAGYAAFANGGTAVTPHLVTKVVDAQGREVPLPWRRPGRRVLTREQAAQVTYALRSTVVAGTGRRAALADRQAAGKTGTSDRNRDAWFVGYVPRLSAAVVMSDARAKTLRDLPGHRGVVSGEDVPAKIWRAFMAKATAGTAAEDFPEPAFAGTTRDLVPPATPAPSPGPEPESTESARQRAKDRLTSRGRITNE